MLFSAWAIGPKDALRLMASRTRGERTLARLVIFVLLLYIEKSVFSALLDPFTALNSSSFPMET